MAALLVASLATLIAGVAAKAFVHIRRPATMGYAWCLAHGWPCDRDTLGRPVREEAFPLGPTAAGTALRSVACVVDGDRPDGLTVLVIHGHRASRHRALALVAPALPAVARIITFDMPGHGDAARDTAGHRVPCTLGLDEPAFLRHALAHTAERFPGPLAVVASSMGAQATLGALAADDPIDAADAADAADTHTPPTLPPRPAIDRLVLLGVYRHFGEPVGRTIRRRRLPAFPAAAIATALLRRTAASRHLGVTSPSLLRPPPPFDRVRDAARIDIPTTLLHGDADPVCPIASAEAIAAALPDGHLIAFPGGGHTTLWQSHPDLYPRALFRSLGLDRSPNPDSAGLEGSTAMPPPIATTTEPSVRGNTPADTPIAPPPHA